MTKSERVFRYVWRINGVILLFVEIVVILALGILLFEEFGYKFAQLREAETGIAVAGPHAKSDLVLNQVASVEGTQVMRAALQQTAEQVKFGSGSGYNWETRNILCIEPGQKAAHWLLPDNDHIVVTSIDITEQKESGEKRVVATAMLVKPTAPSAKSSTGKLLLFDPAGNKIVEVADQVRIIQVASFRAGELRVLYERDKRLVLDVFDPQSIVKLREQLIEIPVLK